MENKKIDMKWCSGYCRQYWPEECAHILRIADDAVAQRFLFDLPWDMEQTVKAVTFEGKIDWRHMPEGDPEFIYQFNRHRYWICLGQAYALTGDGEICRVFCKPAVFLAGGQSHKPGDKEHHLEDHRGRYPGRKLGKGHGIF